MYTDKTSIENYLLTTIQSSFDTQITAWINGVDAWIDTYTGREFESSADTSRLYDGNGTRTILIDDITALTKIELINKDGTVSDTNSNATDWFLYPENSSFSNKIILNPETADFAIFTRGNQNIKLTATFGVSATVPANIKVAATMLVSGIAQKGMGGGNIEREQLGDYEVEYADIKGLPNFLDALEILDQYRYITIA